MLCNCRCSLFMGVRITTCIRCGCSGALRSSTWPGLGHGAGAETKRCLSMLQLMMVLSLLPVLHSCWRHSVVVSEVGGVLN